MKPLLCCKPLAGARESQILYEKNFYEIGNISFRSLDLSVDLKMIHEWVNKNYSKQFWQLHGSKALIENTYAAILENPSTHSYIGLLNDKPICQIDIYLISADELSDHVLAGPDDAGMHFHMAPVIKQVKGLSALLMQSFLNFFFSFPKAERMYGEPDAENIKANKLVEKVGFEFIKSITMTYKRANLWVYTRERFLKYSNV
jgi:RimJ/RimL family protein N-acetyltransferase